VQAAQKNASTIKKNITKIWHKPPNRNLKLFWTEPPPPLEARKEYCIKTPEENVWKLPSCYAALGIHLSSLPNLYVSSCPWVAFQKEALEASPIHPLEGEAQSLLPFQALVVRAKQEATTEHTYSATGKHYIQSVFSIIKFNPLVCLIRRYKLSTRLLEQVTKWPKLITCWAITSFSSCSLAFTWFCASILSFTSSSTLTVYSRINYNSERRRQLIKKKH